MWIVDSGASSHVTNTVQGMYNQRKISSNVKIGSREYADAYIIGDMSGMAIQKYGKKQDITLCNIKYIPRLFCKLISLTTIMNRGFKMTGNGHRMTIEKASTSYTFDQCIKSGDGDLFRLEIELGKIEFANLHIGSMHAILGHPSNHLTNLTAEKMGLKRIQVEATCGSCIKTKQKQKNEPKYIDFKAEEPGGEVFFYLSSIEYKSLGGEKFWLLFVDKYTGFKKTYFLRTKNQVTEKGFEFIHLLQSTGIKGKVFRCDNIAENEKFKEKIIELGMDTRFEVSAPGTPQQNGVIERAFAMLYGRVQAMLNYANIEDDIRKSL